MPRIPILYIAPWVIEGGTDKATIDWFQHIDGRRFAKYLVTTLPSANPWLPRVTPHVDGFWDFGAEKHDHETIAKELCQIIVEKEIKIVHVMNSAAGYDSLRRINSLADAPRVVAQFHTLDYKKGRACGYASYVPATLDKYIDVYDVVSEVMRRYLIETHAVNPSKVIRIYLGVDRIYFHPGLRELAEARRLRVPDMLNVVWVGRLDFEKDPDKLGRVVAECFSNKLPIFFHIVGDGSFKSAKDQLMDVLQRVDTGNFFRLYGFHDDVRPFYGAADVMLMTSRWEGVPLSMMEAMASGLPVVAPDVGGIREFLNSSNGILLEADATPCRIIKALESLRREPGLRARLGRKAREKTACAPINAMATLHHELYAELARQGMIDRLTVR